MSLSSTLLSLFERDLDKLKNELSLYQSEDYIWKIDKNIANSAGNLTLHLVGNLNTYIGAELGRTGYVRNRPLEFSDKNVPRERLIAMLDDTILVLKSVLPNLTDEDHAQEYPQLVLENKTSTGFLMIHLATHLGYHLGQVNYHRRLLDC